MHPIVLAVSAFLNKVQATGATIDKSLITKFGEAAVEAVARNFDGEQRQFTLRMSSVGRPVCQLSFESQGLTGEPEDYNHIVRFMIGDTVECHAVLLMQGAGIKIDSMSQKVSVTVPYGDGSKSVVIDGTYDVEIDGKIWDIKSASEFSFKHKFETFEGLLKDDPFGYIDQALLYSKGSGKKFGGWIVINKSSGEWKVLEFPESLGEEYVQGRMELLGKKLDMLIGGKPVELLEEVPETYRKKESGNYVLSYICKMCKFKFKCFPKLIIRPSLVSQASSKPLEYYTFIKEEEQNAENG